MLRQISNSEPERAKSCSFVRTWVISPSPLREMAHFNKEDRLQQNATPGSRNSNLFISLNLPATLKKFTHSLTTASGLHLYQWRLS